MFFTEKEGKQQLELIDRVGNDFSYHSCNPNQVKRMDSVREKAKELAYLLIENSRPSRELSLGLTQLEQVVFIVNAGIAREKPEQENVHQK